MTASIKSLKCIVWSGGENKYVYKNYAYTKNIFF